MLLQTIEALFRKYRLFCYQKLFSAVREKPGSLSATEAFSADIIHLLGSPTISQFADTIGISQPNATYKVNQLVSKGYLRKTVQAHDRREIVLTTSEKFSGYFDENEEEIFEDHLEVIKNLNPDHMIVVPGRKSIEKAKEYYNIISEE
mgnify:CR=1 FL=1